MSNLTDRVSYLMGLAEGLNLNDSTTEGKVLVKVPHGADVTVLSHGSTWTKVRYNGYTGYMMTRFLKD